MSSPTPPEIPSPDDITLEAFRALLARYPAVVQALSDAKGSKPGQQTLAELDTFRYETAPRRFAAKPDADGVGGEEMGYEDVKTLVAWKLRHGTFRPSLMRMVESNDPALVHQLVEDAVQHYRKTGSVDFPLRALGVLRGVGPATASLLLAVHDPAGVPFFGDEVYAWLCGTGKAPKNYSTREYDHLCEAVEALRARLGTDAVQAVDMEKVAFVLLAGDKQAAATKRKEAQGAKKTSRAAAASDVVATRAAPKRKRAASPADTGRPLRWVEKVRLLVKD